MKIHYIQYGMLYTLNTHSCETKSMCTQTAQNFGIFPRTIRKNTILIWKVFFREEMKIKKGGRKEQQLSAGEFLGCRKN